MAFGSKCSIFSRQVIYIENIRVSIADMRLIPLDHVTYFSKSNSKHHEFKDLISINISKFALPSNFHLLQILTASGANRNLPTTVPL